MKRCVLGHKENFRKYLYLNENKCTFIKQFSSDEKWHVNLKIKQIVIICKK